MASERNSDWQPLGHFKGYEGPEPQPAKLRIELVDGPVRAMALMYFIWHQSKIDSESASFPLPRIIDALANAGYELVDNELKAIKAMGFSSPEEFRNHYWSTLDRLIAEEVPVSQSIYFTFLVENIPVALREQLVRHKVGSKIGPELGVDTIPELVDSTFWSQSGRVLDMSRFYRNGKWFMPETVARHPDPEVRQRYRLVMENIEAGYAALVRLGVPVEDARNVLPFAMVHRTTWTVNLQAIKHIANKRSCWIMQRGLWEDMIAGMVDELSEKSDPAFRVLSNPPCIKGANTWVGCPVKQSNIDRIIGIDPNPPCPLFLSHHTHEARDAARDQINNAQIVTGFDRDKLPNWFHANDWISCMPVSGHTHFGMWATIGRSNAWERMNEEREGFRRLWGRDVDTGELVCDATV